MKLSELADAPDWLLGVIRQGAPRRREKNTDPLIELDHPSAIVRAKHYLVANAPEAVEGANGDQTTYEVAARIKDFGVSEPKALDLLLEHWNPVKAIPPWDPEDLAIKVSNAYLYGTGAPGQISGLAEFDPVEMENDVDLDIEWLDVFDPTALPKRRWLLGNLLARGYVTSLVAPPGAGKTTFEIMAALSLVSGKNLAGFEVKERVRVFLWNQEDELDELKRRVAAAMKAFDIAFDDLRINNKPGLLMGSGAEHGLQVAARNANDKIVPTKAARYLADIFAEYDIGAVFFDPFVELHPADENNNVEIGAVGRIFRSMAVRAGCALMLVHHTRKPPAGESTGHAGSMDSARGAGALAGVARMGATLYGLDAKLADEFGIAEKDRHRYVRYDDAKNNMALSGGATKLYRREGVNIGTMEDPEEVGVLRLEILEKRKTRGERARDALAADIAALVGSQSMPLSEIARGLIGTDPIVYGETKPSSLERTIRRHIQDGNLPEFEFVEISRGAGVGRPKKLLRKIIKTISDISDLEAE